MSESTVGSKILESTLMEEIMKKNVELQSLSMHSQQAQELNSDWNGKTHKRNVCQQVQHQN